MKFALASVLLLGAGFINTCFAQVSADADSGQKRKLIEQKIRLLEMLVRSPAAHNAGAGGASDSSQLLEQGRQALAAARVALTENRHDDASKLLDESLKLASSASRKLSPDGNSLSESAQRKNLADMAEQVATYRVALVELSREPKLAQQASQVLARMDALSSESRQLAEGGRLGDANKKLAAAYRLSVEEIAKMRAGQEVIHSLKFDSPQQEYAYEHKRFASNLNLVEMMSSEGRAEGGKRALVDGFVGEAAKLKAQAEQEASALRHREAVALMEKSNGQLTRALQAMGLPVF